MNEIMVRIRFQLPSLPRAEKVVAEALLETPEAIVNFTLAGLAAETGSSDASIIRFCKRMGYSGYTDFKQAFMVMLNEANAEEPEEEIDVKDDMATILKKVFQSNMQTLTDTLSLVSSNYEEALNAMANARSIHFFGVGDAFAVCELAHMKACKMGIPGSAYSDVTLQLVAAANMGPGDVAFAVSYEGRSRNVVEAMRIAKQNGAATICITKMNKSPLLKVTDIVLFISSSDLTCGREKVTRRVADQAILDALLLGIQLRKGREHNRRMKMIQKAIDRNKV